MAPAWACTAGWWSSRSRCCTGSGGCGSAGRSATTSTRRSSAWPAPSSAGADCGTSRVVGSCEPGLASGTFRWSEIRGGRSGYARPMVRARRVRSARRRQPVLSRIRSRCEPTVRTLMYSSAAICALVRPWATRVTSSRSRALSVPGPGRRSRRAGVGEHQGVLGGGGQAHRRAAVLGGPRPAGPQHLPGLAQLFLPAGLEPGQIGGFLALVGRGARGPQREGLGGAPGGGAQLPALGQGDLQIKPVAGPHGEVEPFPQVRRGVAGAARPQVQVRDPGQQDRLVEQVARVPGPGQARRAGALGFGQVPGIGQHDGQHKAAHPGERAGDPGRDLPGLPGQPDRLVMVAGILGAEAELEPGPAAPRPGRRSPGPGPARGGPRRPPRQPGPSAARSPPGRPGH